MVSVSGVDIKIGRILAVIGILAGGVLLYTYHGSGRTTQQNDEKAPDIVKSAEELEGGNYPTKSFEISQPHRYCRIITYIDNNVPDAKLTVILMHGAKFDYNDWIKIKTMEKLTSWNYRAIALHMKDAENCLRESFETFWNQTMRADAMKQIFEHLDKDAEGPPVKNIVLVSPSKSGEFSIPYLLSKRADLPKLAGYIPIAPVIDPDYKKTDSSSSEVQIFYVQGSNDRQLGADGRRFFGDQDRFPHATINEIQGAGHACYIDKPDDWHKLLGGFLNDVIAKL